MAKSSKIPAYFAQRPMERERLPRAPAGIADTGAGLEAEALGQFGAVLKGVAGDILTKWRKKRTDTQVAEGGAAWERAHTDFFGRDKFTLNGKEYTGLATDFNLEGYEKKYKSFTKDLKKQILKKGLTSQAKSELTNWFTTSEPKMQKEVAIELMKKQHYQGRASMLKAIFDHEKAGNASGAHAAIDSAEKDNYINAEQAEQQRQAVSVNIDWFEGLRMIDIDPGEFLDFLEGDAAPDIDFGFLESLNPEQKLQLKARAIRQQGVRLAKGKELREQQINAEQGRLMNLARKNELTDDIIRTSQLDEFGTGSKNTFYNIIDARAKAALADEDDPFIKSDPQVEARILDELRDPESKITEKDIADLVGKGLSVDDADRLIERLDVFKSFWFRRADSYLKQNLGWSDTFTKFEHPEGAIAYSLAVEELFGIIETENLKDKDLYDRAREIAIPHLVDYWEKALYLPAEKIARLTRMLKIKEPKPKPPKLPEGELLEVKPEPRAPVKTPRQTIARKARIRSWVVPFNKKHKTKLQPTVLDAMSDEFIDWLASLSPAKREEVLKKLEAGETVKPEPIKRKTKGTDLDPEGIF